MKGLLLALVAVLVLASCAGVERKPDKCVVAALETQLGSQERLNERKEHGDFSCEPYETPTQMKESGVEFRISRCVGEELDIDEYVFLTDMYIRSMRRHVARCLDR